MSRFMKHVLKGVGCIVGVVIANLVSDTPWLPWVLGFVGYVCGHYLVAFLHYQKSTPKDFLSFHAPPDTTLTQTNSVGMINDALAKLAKGGLLMGFNPTIASARVNESSWNSLSETERTAFVQILTRAIFLNSGQHSAVEVFAGDPITMHRVWPVTQENKTAIALRGSRFKPSSDLQVTKQTERSGLTGLNRELRLHRNHEKHKL